ncbi:hypothetical protein SDC9_171735 [bioreactor metagenome]|uniref:Uncharacterized protein n=1 Tax=bioreactor metagenome TaxID=1076179 RepID=A0A645GBN6_9ZZZZ
MPLGKRPTKLRTFGIGIKPKGIAHGRRHRRDGTGRRRIRVLVGVELNEVLDLWLLARGIGLEGTGTGVTKFHHQASVTVVAISRTLFYGFYHTIV